MMKSHVVKPLFALLLISVLALSQGTMASPITRQQAQQNALSFMQNRGKSVSMSSLRHAPMRDATQVIAPYYVFNIGDGQGYVIASGDDCAPAVLGYADSGAIDMNNLPCNLKAWLDGYASQIQCLQEHGRNTPSTPREASNRPAVAPLLTCQWSQRDPYNMYCPIDPTTGNRCVTGCVATAMAQLMYFHRHSSSNVTTREIPAYISYQREIYVDAIPAGSFIDWENMIDLYHGQGISPTDAQRQAVANLMKYCGTSIKMDYGSSASSSDVLAIAKALIRYFNYCPSLRSVQALSYSADVWENLIYNEVKNSRPVAVGLSSLSHAVVCDGYDGNGYFHINFGWGGDSDGYYLIKYSDVAQDLNNIDFVDPTEAVVYAEPLPTPSTLDHADKIHFDDQITESVCLWVADENGDRILTKSEAAALTDASKVDFRYSPISLFDEFKYFTGITSINQGAFAACDKLISITLPESIKTIGGYAFNECTALTDFIIPNSVTSIGEYAFGHCLGLTDITIPNSVTSIGNGAFSGCDNLTDLTWNVKNNESFRCPESILRLVVGNDVEMLPNKFTDYCDKLTDLTWNAQKCSSYHCPESLERLVLGNGVETVLSQFASSCMNLKSVSLPNSVTTIGDYAFSGCSALTGITLPNSVTTISKGAFQNCSSIINLQFPNSIECILDNAFYGCTGLTSITIPESVTSIGDLVFNACDNLKTLTWNAPKCPYFLCPKSIERLVFGNAVTSIPNNFAASCTNLTTVAIPSSVSEIGPGAFYMCSGLTQIAIPRSVKSVGQYAFYNCSKMTSVVSLPDVPPVIENSVFDKVYDIATLRVPCNAVEAYRATSPWNRFSNIVGIDPSLGDVNMDEEVGVADVNALIDRIMGSEGDCLSDFMSDVNGDGEINIADINSLIDRILGN